MNEIDDKYRVIGIPALIKAVQDLSIKIEYKDAKKQISPGPYKRMKNDLFDMRNSLIRRLPHEDRLDPRFFPVGSHVTFSRTRKNGRVIDYEKDGFVLIQQEGDIFYTRAEPVDLSLRFIRQVY